VRRVQNSTYGALQVEAPQASFIWKDLTSGNHNGWNELAAYRLSQLLNIPYVPETWICELDGRSGTITRFIPEAFCPAELQFVSEKRKQIKSFLTSENFIQRAALMFAFDAIVGNKDRHAGNWLVDLKNRKMWWIDHGSIHWSSSEKMTLDGFKKLGYTLKTLGMSQKVITQILSAVRDRLENISEETLQGWRGIQYQEWSKVFEDLPEQSNRFSRSMAQDNSWAGFQNILQKKGVKVSEAELQKVLNKIERWTPGEKC